MIEWTNIPVDVKTLCSRPNALPVLARFPTANEEESEPTPATTGQDLGSESNPSVFYLLYAVRKCIKVSGSSLRWDDREQKLNNDGINYVIPVNYPGWFRILSSDRESQSVVASLTSIEQVVASKSTRFLVHSRITGLWTNQPLSLTTTSKKDSFQELQVAPGEVITCGAVFVEPQEACLKQLSRCFHTACGNRKETLQAEKMYLEGRVMASGVDILLPLETLGQFSCIGPSESNSGADLATTSHLPIVYQVKNLVNRNDFPQKVQLVFGIPPSSDPESEQSFTGLIALGHTYSEESIIACQITSEGRLAFLEFPDDSDVEFLLAENWEIAREDAVVQKAIDFCQQYSDSYKLEIQPIIEGNQRHKIEGKRHKDLTDDLKSATFRNETTDTRTPPESFESLPETPTDPTSPQSAVPQTPRLRSGVTDPTTPQKGTVTPTHLQRPQVVPRTPQRELATLNAFRPRVAKGTPDQHQDTNAPHNASNIDPIQQEKPITPNLGNVAAVSLPKSPENGRDGDSVVKKLPVWFTKSLDGGHQLSKKAIALVHTPRPYKHPSPVHPQYHHAHNSTPYTSGRMTDRKLPPVPTNSEAIKSTEECKRRSERSSSEVESNASDPDRLYERIPCQKGNSNEPSPSAPSSPAPTIRNRQETTVTESPSAYDPDGYLTPVELRHSGPVLEREKEQIGCTPGNVGNCKKKLGQNHNINHRRYLNPQTDIIPFEHRCDPERLQSFLDDSVAELYRKQLHRRYSEKTTDTGRERFYRRNTSFDQRMPNRTTLRSQSEPGCSSIQDSPHHLEEAYTYLDTILDCEAAELEEEDCSLRFLHRIASTSLRMRQYSSAANESYQGFDSFSDSGIASRQSTMQNHGRHLATWKEICASWVPPEDLSSLTIEEVAMSLRYIGMKDQIVASFSKEQVDGKLLCEMNNHLLKEGFPNMNSLERKKVLDFVQGWRPKRIHFV